MPTSVILTPDGRAVLVNFLFSSPALGEPLDRSGIIIGSPAYMAPEQARGGKVSPQTDIWGLGTTMYHVITGQLLYGSLAGREYLDELLEQIGSPEPADISRLEGVVPPYVYDIAARCLEKEPGKRYSTAAELRQALELAVEHMDMAEKDTVEMQSPLPGKSILLHVEYQEADLPGEYRQYKLASFVGEGTFGKVYRAKELLSDKEVALKILKSEWVRNSEVVSRFRHEAMLLAKIKHPNILKVYNFGRYGQGFFIATEFLEGPTLAHIIKNKAPMSVEEAIAYILPVLTGISAMHDVGIIHRDLKPANIQEVQDRIIVCDFGLAISEDVTRLTESDMFVGTVPYASPEQARGTKVIPVSDVFSTGVILYEMLTTHRPHEASSLANLIYRIATEPPVPVTEWRQDLPAELITGLNSMLDPNSAGRPSALEAKQLLQGIRPY